MPTHLLLEGEDIEVVLARLRETHGADARIVQAELVRSGGFAGFFAKRRYEVTVEVDESELLAGPDVLAEPAAIAEPPVGMDALLSAAESGDQAEIGGAVLPENDGAATLFVPGMPGIPGWHRPVSTEGAAFSDVLSSLTTNLAEQGAAPIAATPPTPVEPAPSIPQPRLEPVFERMVHDLGLCREQLAAIGVPAPLLAKVVSSEPLLALRDLVDSVAAPRLPVWARSATRGGALVVVVGSWPMAQPTVDGLVRELSVDPTAVLAIATSTQGDLPDGQTVRSHAAGIELVRRSRQSYDVSVVVVDPGPGRHSAERVADLVAVLEPQYVLVAAEAGPEMKASLSALDALESRSVAVDGLALTGVARSAEPAAAFEIPLPVCWVDGRFATSGSWIGILVDAMSGKGSHRC
jgi:hypothetical protein